MYFFQIPADALPEWKTLFEHADSYMSTDYLMGRSKENVLRDRQICLENMGLTNDFDAYLSAEAGKERGNEYFRQGKLGRAIAMYYGSLVLVPLPSTFLNIAAVSLRQKMWGTAEHFCTLALKMEDILAPRTRAKALYRRANARRLLHHEGKYLRPALADITLAHELDPDNADIAREHTTIKGLLALGSVQLKRAVQRQRDALPELAMEYVQTNEDTQICAREQRTHCTRKYPDTFCCKTTGPPVF